MDLQENLDFQPTEQTSTFNQRTYDPNSQPMSVKDWVITLLILAIPIVNIVMYFVWGFGSDVNINKKNYCKAGLIWLAIGVALYIVFIILAIVAAVVLGTATSSVR